MRAAIISVEKGYISGAEGFRVFEGSNGVSVKEGRVGGVPGGVGVRGAHGRDDPVNWEILITPHEYFRCHGEPVTNLQRAERMAGARAVRLRTKHQQKR